MSDTATRAELSAGPRMSVSKGLITIGTATVLLFVVSALAAPSSVSGTALRGMLPIAAVLAVAGLGQMLVIQQGGIDLSVAGVISMTVVAVTHIPDGDNGKLIPAILVAVAFALGAGVVNGLLIGVLGLNPIIATLGTNALLYGADLALSGGRPRITTKALAHLTGGTSAGIPHSVFFALAALVVVSVAVKRTVPGRRFEAIGANARAARAVGLRVRGHRASAYVWAALLYCLAGVMLGGITAQPSAFEGDSFLLISVAVVVLGGTSLLGGRGGYGRTLAGSLILVLAQLILVGQGVESSMQQVALGVLIVGFVAIYGRETHVRDRV
jgi:ribose transport system permease protein